MSRFQRRQRQRGRVCRDGSTYVSLGGTGLHSREGLYLRANKMLLLQLRQHSSLRDSGVRGEIIFVTKIHESKGRREKEKEKGSPGIPMYLKRISLMHGVQKVNNPRAINYANAYRDNWIYLSLLLPKYATRLSLATDENLLLYSRLVNVSWQRVTA